MHTLSKKKIERIWKSIVYNIFKNNSYIH
jgi:hypothetical protein